MTLQNLIKYAVDVERTIPGTTACKRRSAAMISTSQELQKRLIGTIHSGRTSASVLNVEAEAIPIAYTKMI